MYQCSFPGKRLMHFKYRFPHSLLLGFQISERKPTALTRKHNKFDGVLGSQPSHMVIKGFGRPQISLLLKAPVLLKRITANLQI